ncbi:hypothetical protein RvY_07587 [Ramazzottius varieornatus]|uniref:Uncharacterized protein n=1 Tax=Ramazzottius varieornatus TaxID=947166 RepID=A0A1D1V2Q2_RAMVA|nr:hypothetical protein RvY_07587 [Ramazzottius varieornatus]
MFMFTADEWLILQGMTANQLATAATQPAVPSISPGAPAIQPSSLRVPQASSYHASAVTNSPSVRVDRIFTPDIPVYT